MKIPDKAIDAAQEFAYHQGYEISALGAQKIVEAAAPHIAAQAVWDAASKINTHQFGPAAAPYLSAIKAQLKADADEIDPQ